MANSKELTPAKRRNLAELTRGFRGIVLFLFLISGMINVLALTGSLYMMQIYDRALTSGSIPTLLVLSSLVIGLYSSRVASTSSARRCWCVSARG
jgi:ATP-binding cassette subfamily C protein